MNPEPDPNPDPNPNNPNNLLGTIILLGYNVQIGCKIPVIGKRLLPFRSQPPNLPPPLPTYLSIGADLTTTQQTLFQEL